MDNMDFQEQLQQAISTGQYDEAQKLLMQQAVDSGEMTRAFAQAWANKMVNNGDRDGSEAPESEPVSNTAPTQQQQPGQRPMSKRGVSIGG